MTRIARCRTPTSAGKNKGENDAEWRGSCGIEERKIGKIGAPRNVMRSVEEDPELRRAEDEQQAKACEIGNDDGQERERERGREGSEEEEQK